MHTVCKIQHLTTLSVLHHALGSPPESIHSDHLIIYKIFTILLTNISHRRIFKFPFCKVKSFLNASGPPVPGSNLGPGPPHSVVSGAANHTVILYKYCNKTLGSVGCKIQQQKYFSTRMPTVHLRNTI